MNTISMVSNIATTAMVGFVFVSIIYSRKQANNSLRESRNQYTISLLQTWDSVLNASTAAAARIATGLNDSQCDALKEIKPLVIDREHETETLLKRCLADCDVSNISIKTRTIELNADAVAHLRFYIFEYLNATEIILTAWFLGCANADTIKTQLRNTCLDYDRTLQRLRSRLEASGQSYYPSIKAFMEMLEQELRGNLPKWMPAPKN